MGNIIFMGLDVIYIKIYQKWHPTIKMP